MEASQSPAECCSMFPEHPVSTPPPQGSGLLKTFLKVCVGRLWAGWLGLNLEVLSLPLI